MVTAIATVVRLLVRQKGLSDQHFNNISAQSFEKSSGIRTAMIATTGIL